jgi:hypothetical protein
MLAQWLNTIGLALGMAGVVMLFIWGPPQPSFQDYVPRSLEHGTVLPEGTRVAQIIEGKRRQKVRYALLSQIGLGLVGIGFAVQLWATWAQ